MARSSYTRFITFKLINVVSKFICFIEEGRQIAESYTYKYLLKT